MNDLTKTDDLAFLQPNPFAHIYMVSDVTWDQINLYQALRENESCPDSLRQAIDILHEKLDTGRILVKEQAI